MANGRTLEKIDKAQKLMDLSIKLWFVIATIGLFVFCYYLLGFYGLTAARGNFEAWSENSLKGYVEGDQFGNIVFGLHILMAIVISFGGVIQLIPALRRRSIKLHKWNGRLYISTVFLIAIGGLYLIWIRDAVTTQVGSIGVSLNALLMIYFGARTWIAGRGKAIMSHRKWALRTFIVANGVWFFRVGFMAWIMINQGPLWSTENLDGPFDNFWAFGNYLIPLITLEVYFKMSKNGTDRSKRVFAMFMFLFCLLTAIGIVAAYLFMWSPAIG